MADDKKFFWQKAFWEKFNLTLWLERLRIATMIGGGVILGAALFWLALTLPPLLSANVSAPAPSAPFLSPSVEEARQDLHDEFAQQFAELKTNHAQALARLAQEMHDQARKDFESLARRTHVLERDLASRPLPGAIASVNELTALKKDLAKRIDNLSRHVSSPSGSEFALLGLALSALKRAASSGHGFETERIALKALLPNAKILDEMRSSSRAGVRPRLALSRDFAALALRARAYAGAQGSIWDRLQQFVSQIVRVRRVGALKGSSAVAILSRIEARVDETNFPAALEEARALNASQEPRAALMSDALRPWLKDVRARQALDEGLRRLDIRVHEILSDVINKENALKKIKETKKIEKRVKR